MINRTNHEKVEVQLIPKKLTTPARDDVVDIRILRVGKNDCGKPFELCKGVFDAISRSHFVDVPFAK